jgi:hypothetical protein
MLFIVTFMVMVLAGLVAALGTLQGGYAGYLASFNRMSDSYPSLGFIWFANSSSLGLALSLNLAFFAGLVLLYSPISGLFTSFALFIGVFLLLASWAVVVFFISQPLAHLTLSLKPVLRSSILGEFAKSFPFLASDTLFHCLLQNKTPLAAGCPFVTTQADNRAGVRNDNTIAAKIEQLFCLCGRGIIAQNGGVYQ